MNNNILENGNDMKNYSVITFILFWAGLVIMSSLYITIPLISVFQRVFNVSSTEATWTSSSFSICFAIGCLFYGPLSDRYGRKKIILIGIYALTIISLIIGVQNSFKWIVIFRGMQGAAAATFSPVVLSYAVELFPPNKRVGAIGCISTGFLLAGIVGQVFSGNVSQQIGWNYVFYGLAIIYLITAFLILIFVPNRVPNGVNINDAFKQMKKIFRKKDLCFAYIVAFVPLFSFVGMYTALNSYLSSSNFGLSIKQMFVVRLIGVLGMMLSPIAGKLVKKSGVLFVLRSALILSIIGLIFIGVSVNINIVVLMSVIFVTGIAIAVPTLISLIGHLGGEARGAAVSVYTFILFIGASIGPMFTVIALKNGGIVIAFISIAIVMIIGLISTFFININRIN